MAEAHTSAAAEALYYDNFNQLTPVGNSFLWGVFGVMTFSAFAIFGIAFNKHPSRRLFHYVSFTILALAGMSYLCMALNFGNMTHNGRTYFVARYVDWIMTTPLLLLDLGYLANLSVSNIFVLVVLDELMILAGLFGDIIKGPGSWIFFAFGCICFLPLVYFLHEDFDMERAVAHVGEKAAHSYKKLGIYLAALWSFYPIVWILCAVRVVSVDNEVIYFGILDILTKVVFATWLLSTLPSDLFEEMEEKLTMGNAINMRDIEANHVGRKIHKNIEMAARRQQQPVMPLEEMKAPY